MLQFVDCNLSFGPRTIPLQPPLTDLTSFEQLEQCMNAYGIQEAFGVYIPCIEGNTREENIKWAQLCQAFPRIKPVFVALPHQAGDFERPRDFLLQMKKAGASLVKFFPLQQGFTLSEWVCGPLFEVLNAVGVPVLLSKDNALSWDELDGLLGRYPAMPVILCDVGYRANRLLYPLMEKHENLYLETSGLKSFLAIEDFARRFGAQRLIFGSGMPVYDGGAAVCKITYANLSPADKAAIAGGNIKRLVEDVAW